MTNETAEQLREEIAGLFDSAFESGLNKNVPPLGRDEAANESADISINKVLDRVVLNIRAEGGPIAPLDSLDIGFDEGIDVAIKVINKLRP